MGTDIKAEVGLRIRQLRKNKGLSIEELAHFSKKYDAQFKSVFDAIKMLMTPPPDTAPDPKTISGFKP